MKHFLIAAGLLGFASIFSSISLHAGQYFQDFTSAVVGATSFGDGSTLTSTHLGTATAVQDSTYKELQLTASGTTSTRSAFRLPDLDPGAPVHAFSAKWNSEIYGNFPNAAEGFSLTFGQVGSLDLTSSSYFQEAGYPTGIVFSVQTYGNPGFYLRINGNTIASLTNNPTTQWGVFNSTRHFFEVDWNYSSGVSVRVDGVTIFTNVATPGLTIQSGNRFVWAARTGAQSEEVRFDNITVVTGGNLVPAATASPYFSNQGSNPSHESSTAFDGNSSTYWVAFSSTADIGATVSPVATVGVYVLVSSTDTGTGSATDPRSWTLEGSSNGGGNWTSCGTGGGYFVNRQESRAWLATNSTSYGAYRLNISSNRVSPPTVVALGELKFYQFAPVSFKGIGWGQTTASTQQWYGVASSSNGQYLAAVRYNSEVHTSTNYGATWTAHETFGGTYRSVASSANGSKLIAGGYYNVATSSDYGNGWGTPVNAEPHPFFGVASSSDGNKLVAVSYFYGIYTSTDGGFNWRFYENHQYWQGAACSADGSKMAALAQGAVWLSSDFGTNWTLSSAPSTVNYANSSIASSADGTKLAVAFGDGGILASTNSGTSWFFNGAPSVAFASVAMSADGTKLLAVPYSGIIYVSTDSGVTWLPTASPNGFWRSAASSADGSKLVAGAYGGGIWTNYIYSPSLPTLANPSATLVASTAATLNASAVPNGAAPSVWFQWGTTTNYGNTTTPQNLNNDLAPASFNTRIAGLSPATTYYFRAVGSNIFGIGYGADATFITTPPPAPPRLSGIIASNGVFRLAFTNTASETFTVLTSTNVALPLSNWTVIGSATEGPAGQFHFTDPMTNALRFYRVRWP